MPTISVETDARTQVVDVTDAIAEAIPADTDGVVTVFVRHTTAGVTVNEAESGLLGDLGDALSDIVADGGWAHDAIDDNADAHVRAMFVGASEVVPVRDGHLGLGTWQSLLLVECDGPRRRTLDVSVTD